MKLTDGIGKIKKIFVKNKTNIDDKLKSQGDDLVDIEKQIQQESQKIEIYNDGRSTSKIFKFWFVGLLVVVLGYFSYTVLNLIFLIISAYIVSIIVETLVSYLEKKKIKRSIALLISYVVFALVLFGVIIIVVPFMLNQISELLSMAIDSVSAIQSDIIDKGFSVYISDIAWLPDLVKEYIVSYSSNNDISIQIQNILQQNLSGIVSVGQSYASHIGSWAISFLSGFTSFIAKFLLFFTLSVLFSVDKKNVSKFLSKIGGKEKEKINKLKIEKVYKNMAIWLKSRLLLSFFIFVTVFLTLLIMSWCGLEVPNKLGISVIAGLLDIIPYIGPIFTGVLMCVVLVIYNNFWIGILSLIILYVLNFLQENILTPFLMKKTLGISPVLILISMMLGGVIMGFMGVLLSVPISVILVIFFGHGELELKDEKNNLDESGNKNVN